MRQLIISLSSIALLLFSCTNNVCKDIDMKDYLNSYGIVSKKFSAKKGDTINFFISLSLFPDLPNDESKVLVFLTEDLGNLTYIIDNVDRITINGNEVTKSEMSYDDWCEAFRKKEQSINNTYTLWTDGTNLMPRLCRYDLKNSDKINITIKSLDAENIFAVFTNETV